MHISHLKSTGFSNAGNAQRILERIDEANEQGIEVSFDVYPYDVYSTYSSVLFPSWVLAGGTEAFSKRVADPSTLARLKAEMPEIYRSQTLGSLDNVMFRSIGDDYSLAGRTLADWMRIKDRPQTLDAGFDALIVMARLLPTTVGVTTAGAGAVATREPVSKRNRPGTASVTTTL